MLAPEGDAVPALADDEPVGFDQLCRVAGMVTLDRTQRPVACLGRRSARRPVFDTERFESLREVSAWYEPGEGVVVSSLRPRGARGHAADVITAALLEPGTAPPVADPRLSTTYTATGAPARMTLELWLESEADAEQYLRRIAGEAIGTRALASRGALEFDAELLRCYSRGRDGRRRLPPDPLPMSRIEAIISDFGGVLTSPMLDSFRAFHQASGISPAQLGEAMAAIGARQGTNPLFELETGRMSEAAFLGAIADELTRQLERPVRLDGFGEQYFGGLSPNERLIGYMRELRQRGYTLAICSNNVREWDPLWRAMLPVDELFEVVVVSAFVGSRKPERRIFEITLERLDLPASATVMVDDIEVNCATARELGINAVWFRETEQAIDEIEAAIASC